MQTGCPRRVTTVAASVLAAAGSRVHRGLLWPATSSSIVPCGTAIDMGSYLRAGQADRSRLHPEPLPGEPTELRADRPWEQGEFVQLKDLGVPPKLLAADAILKDAYGTGFDGISAVLGTAAIWTPREDKVVDVSRAELRDAVISWSNLAQPEIDAALDRLTLTPEQLRQNELRFWEQAVNALPCSQKLHRS